MVCQKPGDCRAPRFRIPLPSIAYFWNADKSIPSENYLMHWLPTLAAFFPAQITRKPIITGAYWMLFSLKSGRIVAGAARTPLLMFAMGRVAFTPCAGIGCGPRAATVLVGIAVVMIVRGRKYRHAAVEQCDRTAGSARKSVCLPAEPRQRPKCYVFNRGGCLVACFSRAYHLLTCCLRNGLKLVGTLYRAALAK
jgi:hypothetical protein